MSISVRGIGGFVGVVVMACNIYDCSLHLEFTVVACYRFPYFVMLLLHVSPSSLHKNFLFTYYQQGIHANPKTLIDTTGWKQYCVPVPCR